MKTFAVVLYLLLSDGHYVCTPPDCKTWPQANSMEECRALLKQEEVDLHKQYDNTKPSPTGFMTMCLVQEGQQ